jgi:hypothetical protein
VFQVVFNPVAPGAQPPGRRAGLRVDRLIDQGTSSTTDVTAADVTAR